MSRRELREQIFKFIFRVEFNTMEEMAEQEKFFFEDDELVIKEEDAAYMTEVASFINDKLAEIQKTENYGRLSPEHKQILLGMNLADDYFHEKKKNQILESELELKDKELYSLKHELISLQIDLEKLQKEAVKGKE